jgi:hypothetical protein
MTQEEYPVCPECGSDNIHWNEPNGEDNALYLPGWCDDCGAEWVDVYEFKETRIVKGPEGGFPTPFVPSEYITY